MEKRSDLRRAVRSGLSFANGHRQVTTLRTTTRRAFLQRGALVVAALPAWRWRLFDWRVARVLRIGVIGRAGERAGASDRALGIRLGIDEASHSAALFGGSIEAVPITLSSLGTARVSAVIGGDETRECALVARAAEEAGVVFMNVGCANDALRGEDCGPMMFHVVPSEAMYRDALRGQAESGLIAAAWDSSLERFGADTLNGRFRARFGRGMSADAWLAWMAVKVLWEASLRVRSADARALVEYLTQYGTQFDGHKGVPLSFRAWDHQLRQPLYVVSAGQGRAQRVIGEVPSSVSSEQSSRDALDRLGTPAAQSTCKMPP